MARQSLLPVTILVPSGEKFTLFIPSECPFSSPIIDPDFASQIMARPSKLPVTIRLSTGEKLTLVISFEWLFSSLNKTPDFASHMMASLSELPVTIRVPSGEKLTQFILPEWPIRSGNIPIFNPVRFALLKLVLTKKQFLAYTSVRSAPSKLVL